jgi:hypothetical protein
MGKKAAFFRQEKLFLFFFLGFMIFSGTIFAGEILVNNGTTEFRITAKSYQSLSFSTTISSVQYRDIQTKSGPFNEIFITGYGFNNKVGDPKLPVFHELIETPLKAGFSIIIRDEKFKEYDLSALGINNLIIPAQAPVPKNITDPDQIPFIQNVATYKMDQWLGGPIVKITPIGIMRSLNLARLDISPVWYNPVTGKIRVYEQLDITITFTNPDISSTILLKKQSWSPYFLNLYARVGNYMQIPDSLITIAPVTYVIIADPAFHDALRSFISWKKKKGFNVIVGYTNNPAVGTTTSSIKNYLQGLYNNPPTGYQKPGFVLFAGDIGQIPTWTSDGHPTDLYYCDYTGDNIPDVFYGRFAAQNVTQLQAYIDKTLEYEQYTMPSDAFLGSVTMVAGADPTYGQLYGNGQINYGTSNYFNAAHAIFSNTYLQPEPTGGNYAQDIHQNISDGVAFANYTAHGSEEGWADPEFLISDIDSLQNNHKFCLMIGNCCLTANFSIDCFAKEVTRTAQKGALGYIGCSDYSYWDEDFWWACGYKTVTTNPVYDPQHLGAYDGTFHDHGENLSQWFVTMDQMVFGGDLAVEESSSGLKQYYWETYNLMGDPSLSVYYSVPEPVAASYPDSAVVGISTLTVTTEPYAYVALSIHDTTLLAAKCADTSGIVYLTFNPLTSIDSLCIVITKQNRKPHIGSIHVVPAAGPYVVLSTYTINDSLGGNNDHLADYGESILLNVTLNNIGNQNTSTMTGTLSTSDTNITITSGSFNFGKITAGGMKTGKNAFSLTIHQYVQDQHQVICNLNLTDDTNTWNSTLIMILNAPVLAVNSVTVLDPLPGGNNNGALDPGESARLRISISNTGHASCSNAIAHLTAPSFYAPYIIVPNTSYYLGNLGSGISDSSYFPVTANGITPPGTVVSLNFIITGGEINQYSALDTINLTIGQIPQYDMGNDTTITCAGKFYDSGGPDGNYSDNENYIYSFLPGTPGAMIKVVFNAFDVEEDTNCNYDWLKIFNGPDISSPMFGKYCGSTIPGPFVSTAGPLTFQFSSDNSVNLAGWVADISCIGGPLNLVADGFPANVCQGSSSQLVVIPSGGSGNYSYQWNPVTYLDDPASSTPVSTPLSSISYTVTVYDGYSSLTSGDVTLNVDPVPSAPTIIYHDGSLISNSSTNQWYLNDCMIPDATDPVFTPVASGVYYVTARDTITSCQSLPSNRIYYPNTGIDQPGFDNMVSVYPNPFMETIFISYYLAETGTVRISLFDALGKELRIVQDDKKQTAGKHMSEMTAGTLKNGLYILKVQTPDYTIIKRILLLQ